MRHKLLGPAAAALMMASPMFGKRLNLVDAAAQSIERKVKRHKKREAYFNRDHARLKEKSRFGSLHQFPEYVKLRDRNIASGKWAANIQ